MHRLWKLRPEVELTLVERMEMDTRICWECSCSTEYYKAQVELARHRLRFHSQKRVIGSSPTRPTRSPETDLAPNH